jgi:hypothetical protein
MENTSGQGKQTVLPAELAGWSWNWGAFFWNWVWGIFNKTYIALLMFVPLVNIFMPFILGFKGNAWAWRNKKWESFDHFRKAQRKWAIWGFISLLVSLLATAGGIFYFFEEVKNSEPYVMAMNKVQMDKEALKILGGPIEPGWWFTGSLSTEGGIGKAELAVPVKGPAQEGKVHIKAIRDKGQWKIEQLVLAPDGGGAAVDLLKTPKAPPAPVPAATSAAVSKETPPPDARPVLLSRSKSAAASPARVRKPARRVAPVKQSEFVSDYGFFAIHLNNGGRFLTPRYWEENQEIKFYIAGGVMGIEKRNILKIDKIDDVLRIDAFIPPAPSAKPPPEAPAKKDNAAAPQEKVDIQAYKGRKDQMTTELDEWSERLRDATRRKDQAAKTRALDEMRNKSAQIYDLTDEVTEKNKGKLPDGWWDTR